MKINFSPLFQYFKTLKTHFENKHSTVSAFKCTLCDYSHSRKWGLKQHIKNNHGDRNGRAGKCHICGNVSSNTVLKNA
jgi:hypothetical protein